MNKIIEKIIMGLFYIICFLSFGITVIELPNVLNEWFNTLRFSGSSFVILIILLVLLYYVYNRHITIENNKETENRRELSDNINFVNYLNEHNGFSGGDFVWSSVSSVAPTFHFVDKVSVAGMTREQKLAKITELVNQPNTYVVAEVKGNTGQHWVAIDGVNGNNVIMMDPGSDSTDMWSQYNWNNTSTLAYFRVS